MNAMGEFIRKVRNMNISTSVNMKPEATMGWRKMWFVNRGTTRAVARRDKVFRRSRGDDGDRWD